MYPIVDMVLIFVVYNHTILDMVLTFVVYNHTILDMVLIFVVNLYNIIYTMVLMVLISSHGSQLCSDRSRIYIFNTEMIRFS